MFKTIRFCDIFSNFGICSRHVFNHTTRWFLEASALRLRYIKLSKGCNTRISPLSIIFAQTKLFWSLLGEICLFLDTHVVSSRIVCVSYVIIENSKCNTNSYSVVQTIFSASHVNMYSIIKKHTKYFFQRKNHRTYKTYTINVGSQIYNSLLSMEV